MGAKACYFGEYGAKHIGKNILIAFDLPLYSRYFNQLSDAGKPFNLLTLIKEKTELGADADGNIIVDKEQYPDIYDWAVQG